MIVKFFNWDQPKNVHCFLKDIKKGDAVVVDHDWGGEFLANVLIPDKSIEGEVPVGKAVRKATSQDRELALNNSGVEKQLLLEVKREVRSDGLEMKIVDVKIGLDNGCIVIAFIADGRVDFRDLVKKLSNRYHKTVRFQQIGSRDEARRTGDCGTCGLEVCCRKFSGSLKSISTEMARCQLISHRGSERISGICGRLMCCLSFEADQYQSSLKGMPEKGDSVVFGNEKGKVLDYNVLLGKVKVEKEDGIIVEVRSDLVKKC